MTTADATSNCKACATLRSAALRPLYPRRLLLTSMTQALIAVSLALSIMTFVVSLIEFLPMRESDIARQESLQYNTFICLIVPIILAYCSQSRVIAALTQKWILRRVCSLQDCLSPANFATKLGEAFRHTAAVAGLSCVTGPLLFSENESDLCSMSHKKLMNVGSSLGSSSLAKDEAGYLHSSKLVTTNVIISADH